MRRRLATITVAASIPALVSLHAGFAVANAETAPKPSCGTQLTEEQASNEDIKLACKIAELPQKHLSFSDDGKNLETDLSDDQLRNDFAFSDKQVDGFRAILAGNYQPSTPNISFYSEEEGKRFYISNEGLKAGTFATLATAATAGPEALAAAFVAVSSLIGGPMGGIFAAGVGLLGAAYFADLAVKITGALAQGKGLALYLTWGVPPIDAKIE